MQFSQKEKEALEKLKNAVIFFDEQEIIDAVNESLAIGMDAKTAVFQGLVPGIEEVSRLYDEEGYFIPEMLMCTEVLYKGLDLLRSRLSKKDLGFRGSVIIGVVEGDIHDIGKNVVKIMLEVSGFDVHDLGRDVHINTFMEEYNKLKPDLVCLSAMMTTTTPEIKKIINKLKKQNPNVIVLVGGAAVTEQLASRWQANAYAKNAHFAVKAAVELLILLKNLQLK